MDFKPLVLPAEIVQSIVAHFSFMDCKDLALTSKTMSSVIQIHLKKYEKLKKQQEKKQRMLGALNAEMNLIKTEFDKRFEQLQAAIKKLQDDFNKKTAEVQARIDVLMATPDKEIILDAEDEENDNEDDSDFEQP